MEGKRLAKSFFDFINVRLYDHPDKYELKKMKYWIWSEEKQELQEYETTEGLTYEQLEPYIEKELVWIK